MKKTVGDLLREARTKKGLALQTIARETGISDHHLLAIELDQFALIPEDKLDTFLGAYAVAVDLDVNELKSGMANQEAEQASNQAVSTTSYDELVLKDDHDEAFLGSRSNRRVAHEPVREKKKTLLPLYLLSALAVGALLFVGYNFWQTKDNTLLKQVFAKVARSSSSSEEEPAENTETSSEGAEATSSSATETVAASEEKVVELTTEGGGESMAVTIKGASAPIELEISFDGTSTGMGQSWIGMTNLKSETTAIMLDSGSTYTDEFAEDAKEVELSFGITEGISIKIAGEELDLSPITSRSNSTITLTIE